jgi:hypothetical protein
MYITTDNTAISPFKGTSTFINKAVQDEIGIPILSSPKMPLWPPALMLEEEKLSIFPQQRLQMREVCYEVPIEINCRPSILLPDHSSFKWCSTFCWSRHILRKIGPIFSPSTPKKACIIAALGGELEKLQTFDVVEPHRPQLTGITLCSSNDER